MSQQTPHPRNDMQTATLVQLAVAALPHIGVRRAAQFLAATEVAPDIAVRTLVYPRLRRA